ncbi:sigma-54-dependent Fis family transcriptional regulator [Polaromonas sp. SM01]|uniref:sigma-54-dependent Fis family transcriptional regulator n=1 Tax=Polaromonas sp. SM01 TaxID=3085630 RepID=UPI0029816429|nr:helix-turn-helix domain-containing protein [Polaromonas sp. SM01]MDW5444592.1 helix-turn-helix domain-containing protein [Polaromonas sp. SM01]
MLTVLSPSSEQRLQLIAQARQAVMQDGKSPPGGALADSWIERSWQRCLASGQRPDQDVGFDLMSPQVLRRTEEANHVLVQAARPVLEKLGAAIASTHYFAILTNAQGVVVDVNGSIDRRDRRADLITRIGVDLSEQCVGTTAIGAALTELQPVWLHRGEHFFNANSAYSCAGAPVFGPDGRCAGMLDLTGVDAVERPELKHLVAQSARHIENALMQGRPHELLIRLNWSSPSLGEDSDGLVCLDADGWVTGANPAARQMVPALQAGHPAAVHCSELFAMPYGILFDAAKADATQAYPQAIDVPLWSGLRLHALPLLQGRAAATQRLTGRTASHLPLKDVETALIRKAVSDARGNVMKAARTLGISRATVYRRLGSKTK